MTSSYLDFELEIGTGQGRDYPVAVLRSPAGEARATMRFPFDELALENRILTLEKVLLRSGGKRRLALSNDEQAVLDFGRTLFDSLLVDDVRSLYYESHRLADQHGCGLRLKLRFAAPGLAALPWEFLYDARRAEFVCLSVNTPLVRYLERPQPPRPLTVQPPLRILGMIVSPTDLPDLDLERERARLEKATEPLRAKGLVDLTWLAGQTWRNLQREMRRGPWHIFHFAGHGSFDVNADEGMVTLADDAGRAQPMRATELGRLLADHKPLHLAVLNACEGGRGSERDIFSSTAAILVQRGLPAVLAMQYEITDRAAIELTRAFYEALADGLPVDAAVAEARKAVSLSVANTFEWGTPVLYMRSPDGVLFDVSLPVQAPAQPAAPPPAPVQPVETPEPTKPAEKPKAAEPTGKQDAGTVQVFLSYAPADEAAVVQLYDKLAAVGLKPWMEKRDLLPGEQRQDTLLRAARSSQFFLTCVSSKSVDQRGLLQRSLRVGLDVLQEKLPGDIYLIPIRLDDCSVPMELQAFQVVDLFSDNGWTMVLKAIAHGIIQVGGELPAGLGAELERSQTVRAVEGKLAPMVIVQPDQRRAETPPSVLTITEVIRMELVRVPAGEFLMGSDPQKDNGAYGVEQPQHSLRLDEFYIGKYPVTNSQYGVFVKATRHEAPSHWQKGSIPRGKEEHPVVNVTWHDAVAFCQWLAEATGKAFRLPSEAEWEKAASWDEKAKQKRIWPWGNTFDAARCNTDEAKLGGTSLVGAYSPAGDSPCGATDMAGNVWEWTSSLWGKDISRPEFGYLYDPNDGRENQAAPDDVLRVLRGGSFIDRAGRVRCAFRVHASPYGRLDCFGFRVCVSPSLR